MDLARTDFLPEDELEALFKVIPSPQLQKFRQVSKECKEVAERVLRKRRDIKLSLSPDNFQDFLDFLNNSPENVFVAPVIHIKNTNISCVEEPEEERITRVVTAFVWMRKICTHLGNQGIIKELLIEDGETDPHFCPMIVLALLSQLPTLETLKITKLKLSSATFEHTQFQLPSLKRLHFGYAKECDVTQARNLLKIIYESSPKLELISSENDDLDVMWLMSKFRDAKRRPELKGIVLTKSSDLEILLKDKPKIVLLYFQIKTEEKDVVDSKELWQFLQQQAATLKSFKCNGNGLVPKSIFTIPELPVLEELTFEALSSGSLMSVNYGRQTPALKTLKISSTEGEQFLFYEVSSEMPSCPSLEELDVYNRGGGRADQKVFDNWKNLFPNLKRLGFGNPEQFDIQQFSKCWPKLEALTLSLESENEEEENKDLDELVFGLSPDWKKQIDTTAEEWWTVPPPEVAGTIANLGNLKELKLDVRGFRGTVTMTDFAIYFGLRLMENLRKIEITATTAPDAGVLDLKMSEEAFKRISENLPNLEKFILQTSQSRQIHSTDDHGGDGAD